MDHGGRYVPSAEIAPFYASTNPDLIVACGGDGSVTLHAQLPIGRENPLSWRLTASADINEIATDMYWKCDTLGPP
jgi:hypothetical protein